MQNNTLNMPNSLNLPMSNGELRERQMTARRGGEATAGVEDGRERSLRERVHHSRKEAGKTVKNLKEVMSVKSSSEAVLKGVKIGHDLRSDIKEGNFEGSVFYIVLILSIIKDLLDFVALAGAAAAGEAVAAAAAASAAAAGATLAAGATAGLAASGVGLLGTVVTGGIATVLGYVSAGLTVTVGTLISSAIGMEIFIELINVIITVILFIVFFMQTSWLKKYLFKRFAWPMVVEFIPIINYFPTYTFMTILLKIKTNKEKNKKEDSEAYGEKAYA